MAEEKAKPESKPAAKPKPEPQQQPSEADAPGPITPEHESGSWEQTQEEQERRSG